MYVSLNEDKSSHPRVVREAKKKRGENRVLNAEMQLLITVGPANLRGPDISKRGIISMFRQNSGIRNDLAAMRPAYFLALCNINARARASLQNTNTLDRARVNNSCPRAASRLRRFRVVSFPRFRPRKAEEDRREFTTPLIYSPAAPLAPTPLQTLSSPSSSSPSARKIIRRIVSAARPGKFLA